MEPQIRQDKAGKAFEFMSLPQLSSSAQIARNPLISRMRTATASECSGQAAPAEAPSPHFPHAMCKILAADPPHSGVGGNYMAPSFSDNGKKWRQLRQAQPSARSHPQPSDICSFRLLQGRPRRAGFSDGKTEPASLALGGLE